MKDAHGVARASAFLVRSLRGPAESPISVLLWGICPLSAHRAQPTTQRVPAARAGTRQFLRRLQTIPAQPRAPFRVASRLESDARVRLGIELGWVDLLSAQVGFHGFERVLHAVRARVVPVLRVERREAQ